MLLLLNIGVDALNILILKIRYHMMILGYMRATPDIQHGKRMATENGHR